MPEKGFEPKQSGEDKLSFAGPWSRGKALSVDAEGGSGKDQTSPGLGCASLKWL